MSQDSVNYAKGETPMTDLQYQDMEALRKERDALKAEMALLKTQGFQPGETGMTDYQFKAYEALRDKREQELMRKLETLYNLVKTKADAGASSQEIWEAVVAMKDKDQRP